MELQLFSDLLGSYNKFVRPVQNASHILVVKFGSSLIRIIDVVRTFSITRCYDNL